MITSVEMVSRAGLIRKDGVLTPIPPGSKAREVDFGNGPAHVVAIPWGDLATAYRSTGIPNIETYIALPPIAQTVLRGASAFSPVAASSLGQRIAQVTCRPDARRPGPHEPGRRGMRCCGAR